jgi:SRSO17 transposase
MTEKQLQACASRLEEFTSVVLVGLGRSERRQHGALYVQGLLLDGERKSIEPLAARVPGGNVQALQQLVGQSPWAWEPVREQLAQRMQEALLPVAGWIIDDTGFPKQGRDSVGVGRQYSGTLGKVGNCQIAVSIHLTTDEESVPLDWALYLPQEWITDPERCRKAGVPEGTLLRTKLELGLALVDQLREWGLTRVPVLADVAYGKSTAFRQGLVDRQLQYVVGVEPDTAIWTEPTRRVQPARQPGKGRPPGPYYKEKPTALEAMAAALAAEEWKTVRWREGSRGPQQSRFTARRR